MVVLCSLAAILNVGGIALFKYEIGRYALEGLLAHILFAIRPLVIVGGVMLLGSAVSMLRALALAPMTTVVPITIGFNFIFTLLLGALFLREHVTFATIGGMVLILGGLLLINVGRST